MGRTIRPAVICGLLLLLAAPAAAAAPRDGVYVGRTESGNTVRFLVSAHGTRVGDLTFGRLHGGCGALDAALPGFFRVRGGGSFSGFVEYPETHVASVGGRLLSRGRARGTALTTSRVDCFNKREAWTARRVRTAVAAEELQAGPALAGSRVAWAEGDLRRAALRIGGPSRETFTLLTRATYGRLFDELQASRLALAFDLDEAPYAGPTLGPFFRLAACGPTPAVDGAFVLYERQVDDDCGIGSRSELRLRDLGTGADTRLALFNQPSGALRLAGSYVAVANEDLIYVLDRTKLNGALIAPASGAPGSLGPVGYAAGRSATDGFDVQSDGKLAVTRVPDRSPCAGCPALEWYSPSEPRAHRVEGVFAAASDIALERDLMAYVVRVRGGRALMVSGLDGRGSALAVLTGRGRIRTRLLGFEIDGRHVLDFDGRRLAFASRTLRRRRGASAVRGPRRIEVLRVPQNP